MTTPFSNSIVGEQGTLVRSQIKSPNFSLAGQTGWAILKNGSAYFFNVTATGTITATQFVGTDFFLSSAGAFFYSGAPASGDLVASISTQSSDGHGNIVIPTIASYATSGQYAALSNSELILGSLNPSSTALSSTTFSSITSLGATDFPQLTVSGATANNTTGNAVLQLAGGSQDGVTAFPLARLAVGPSGTQDLVEFDYNGHILRVGVSTVVAFSVTGNVTVAGSFNVGSLSGQHFGLDNTGKVYLCGPGGVFTNIIATTSAPQVVMAANGSGVGFNGYMDATTALDFTTFTINSTSVTQASKQYTIPANDAQAGTKYRLTVEGHGTQAGTAEIMAYLVNLSGTAQANCEMAASFAGASAAFGWTAVIELKIKTTGATGTANLSLRVHAGTGNFQSNGIAYGWVTGLAINTTVANTLELEAQWVTAAGTTISDDSQLERLGP